MSRKTIHFESDLFFFFVKLLIRVLEDWKYVFIVIQCFCLASQVI